MRQLVPAAYTYDVRWNDVIHVVDAGDNLERIGCPHCGRDIGLQWFLDLLEHVAVTSNGFPDLTVTVPCCGTTQSLEDLDYDWPTGYARWEVAAWSPDRDWLTEAEMAQLAAALGHPVRQIMCRL